MPRHASAPPREVLILMARPPRPGRAKTRLIPRLGAAGAARVCEGFILDTLDLAGRAGGPVAAFTAGRMPEALRRAAPAGTAWAPQGPGDLGARMRRAFARCFAGGAVRCVMLGTDSPGLPLRHVREAFRRLRASDAVVGPALDGGYYLLGLARPTPELLRGMPWSSPDLLRATHARAAQLGLSLAVLPPWFDVDQPADLDVLAGLAAAGRLRPRPRHTLARLDELDAGAPRPALTRKKGIP